MMQFYGVYNVTRQYTGWVRWPFLNQINTGPVVTMHENSWTPDNTDARYEAVRLTSAGSDGTLAIEDGSYLRLKTAEIAYTFKTKFASRFGVKSVRIYLNGDNLLFWSDVVEDREQSASNDSLYPMTKRYNLGINIKF